MSTEDADPATQDEIPYVPPAQRKTVSAADPNADDTIVVVGQRRKKRKRQGRASADAPDSGPAAASPLPHPTKRPKNVVSSPDVDGEAEVLADFDYAAAPNILDEPTPVAAARTKKRREKGGRFPIVEVASRVLKYRAGGGVQYGNFPAPPRDMSEVKSGNQSFTFR